MNIELQSQNIQKKSIFLFLLLVTLVGFLGWIHSLFFPEFYRYKVIIATYVFFLFFILKDIWFSSQSFEIAETLGGVPIQVPSKDFKHQLILNVVEEVCVAAQIKMPFVYVLKSEKSINAFLLGSSKSDYSIGLTQGALDQLSRDELQALIAHHISLVSREIEGRSSWNDFVFYQHITSCVKAFVFVVNFAEKFIRFNDSRSVRSIPILAFLGGCIWILGGFGYFLARILQILFMRQKFKWADLGAVRLTRNPEALARVLLKIEKSKSFISQMTHHEYSHFFFANTQSHWIDRFFPIHENIQSRIQKFYREPINEVNLKENLFLHPWIEKSDLKLSQNQISQNQRILKLVHSQSFMSRNAGMKLLSEVSQSFRDLLLSTDQDAIVLLAVLYFEQEEFVQQKIRTILENDFLEQLKIFTDLVDSLSKDSFLRILAFRIVMLRLQKKTSDQRTVVVREVREFMKYDHQWTFVELIQHLMLCEIDGENDPLNDQYKGVSHIKLIDLFWDTSIINLEEVRSYLVFVKKSPLSERKGQVTQLVFELLQTTEAKNGLGQKQKEQLRWLSLYWNVVLPLVVWDSVKESINIYMYKYDSSKRFNEKTNADDFV